MKFRPLDDRVLVKPDDATKASKGGILLPHADKEVPVSGVVQAIGEGRYLESGFRVPMLLKVGDRVFFNLYAGADIELDDERFKVLRQTDILGTVVSK